MQNRLEELITYLEYGTKLHIGVVFLGSCGHGQLRLPSPKRIHASPFCDAMKARPNGLNRCFRCRNAAIEKAVQTQTAFDGLCINGVYEYTRPLMRNGEVVCVIYVGNIIPAADRQRRLRARLQGQETLLDTMQTDFSVAQCEAVGRLIEDFIRSILETAPDQADAEYDPLTENLKTYVRENLEYAITLSHLAKIFHYNEKYLGRVFRARVGMRFHEYLNAERLSYAEEHLRNTEDSVIEIATRAGFQNVTYFNRVFRKKHGMTPTQYRKGENLLKK